MKNSGMKDILWVNRLAAAPFLIPLIFVPLHYALNKSLRWGLLVTIASLCILFASPRTRLFYNFKKLSHIPKIAVGVFLLGALLSTLWSVQAAGTRLIGWDTEYLGILAWLSFLILALVAKSHFLAFLKSRLALQIGAAVLVISLLGDLEMLWYGYRLTGLLQQATSMGMFAAIVLGLCVWHGLYSNKHHTSRWFEWALPLLAAVEILLSQSRLALAAGILVCLLPFITYLINYRKMTKWPLILLGVILVVPIVAQGYFGRLRSEQVAAGFSYRSDVYKASLHDIQSSNYIIGYGASGIPETINSRNKAPEGIIKSLDQGFVFLSAHDIFLDIALMFGAVAGIGFIILILLALRGVLTTLLIPENQPLVLVFVVSLLNGIFNVPSLEMTTLLFSSLLALLPGRQH